PSSSLMFPYPTLFRSVELEQAGPAVGAERQDAGARGEEGRREGQLEEVLHVEGGGVAEGERHFGHVEADVAGVVVGEDDDGEVRSEEHTSELQSRENL